jgi:RND family efflux transporter MFP subunit
MSRGRLIGLAVAVLIVLALAWLIVSRVTAKPDQGADVAPTATITVATLVSQPLTDIATAYGTVQADPASTSTLAAPRPVVVEQMLARVGEAVRAGQALAVVSSTPAATLAFRQAEDAARFAKADLARVQRLYDAKLAANDQLQAARKVLADAEAGLATQQAQGAGRQSLAAPAAGVVASVAATAGDHLAQDAPLLTVARLGSLRVKLALEPAQGHFATGQAVTLKPATGGPATASSLSLVGHAVDPASRNLDAYAPLNGAPLPLGAGVAAEIVTGTHQGLTAPRQAVVFDETGAHVFVIAGNKAKRVFVTVGADHGDAIEIKSGVAAGQSVAVQGAYELEDGMAVKVARR